VNWSQFTDTTTGGSLAFETRGGRRIGSFVNLAVPAWTVVSSTAESELAGTFSRTRAIDAFFLLALAGLVAIAFVFLVGRATRSLEELTRAAAKVGEGDLDPALPKPTFDEVGTLTHAFAQMLGRVRDMMREIEVSRQLAVLGEFAAQLSHEVRNPLTSLKLDLQGMQRRVKTGELASVAAPAIESALREINRLDTVVRGVLELARQQPIARERCGVHETLDVALDGLRAQLGERCIDVDRCFEAKEASLRGDRHLLAGMFMNLLLNASQAQPNGGAIGIRSSNRDVDGARWIDVTIADNGLGIPPARRDEVFRPFQTSRHDGTGLGLPLALRTAREHGGHIAIVDPPDGYTGAAFVVSLPLDAQ
jgi:signal transduction histidine kinase